MLPNTPTFERRALNRVTFGATDTDEHYAQLLGWPAWVNEQLAAPPGDDAALAALVRTALNEDAADRDITTIATVRAAERARARLVARQAGVISGVPLALATFRALDAEVSIRVDADDGATLAAGQDVLFISGHARAISSSRSAHFTAQTRPTQPSACSSPVPLTKESPMKQMRMSVQAGSGFTATRT